MFQSYFRAVIAFRGAKVTCRIRQAADAYVGRLDVITKSKEEKLTASATFQKRQELMEFIGRELMPEPAVQAVVGMGSIASGLARPDSGIALVAGGFCKSSSRSIEYFVA